MNKYRVIFSGGDYTDVEAVSVTGAASVAASVWRELPGVGGDILAIVDHDILNTDIGYAAYRTLFTFVTED